MSDLLLLSLSLIIIGLVAIIFFLYHKLIQYRHESLTDHLTQLPNRRFFDQELKREMAENKRYQRPLSLITLDLDYFKQYNDTQGHPAGDRQLKKFASLLKSMLRESDLCARTGGEEFGVILPQTDKSQAKLLAERIRCKIEEELNPTTASLGISEFPTDAKDEKDLIEKSDQALYEAKKKRNCVVAFEEN